MIKLLCIDAHRTSFLQEGTVYTQWALLPACCERNQTWVQLEEITVVWRAGTCRGCGAVIHPTRAPFRRSRFIQLNDPQADTREDLTEEPLEALCVQVWRAHLKRGPTS